MKEYIMFNPIANNGNSKLETDFFYLANNIDKENIIDITKQLDYYSFFEHLNSDDIVYLLGGDGTLNRFVNSVKNISIKQKIFYYPTGSGNDFYREFGNLDLKEPILINDFLNNLPKVFVNNQESLFLNGVGFGIDGYCCEKGEELRYKKKKVNYGAIAVKGLLFHYKPNHATVVVDGIANQFKDVWLCPTMNGKYYGGGMIPTPNQIRNSNKLSIMVFSCPNKLKVLRMFPSIFKGKHVKYKNNVKIFEGKEIEVIFDTPKTVQIDGEVIKDVVSYKAIIEKD